MIKCHVHCMGALSVHFCPSVSQSISWSVHWSFGQFFCRSFYRMDASLSACHTCFINIAGNVVPSLTQRLTLTQLLRVPFLDGELFLVLQPFPGLADLDFELLSLLLLQVVKLFPSLGKVVLERVGKGESWRLLTVLKNHFRS